MTDDELLGAMRSGQQKAALKQLYGYYPAVRQMILKNNGSRHDAEDIYQEALIILFRKVKEKDFRLTSSINTFLFSICRLQWMNELRKRQKEMKSDDFSENVPEQMENCLQEEEQFRKAENALQQLGEKCRQILQLFYAQKKSLAEIADAVGLSNEKVARTQKHRCMEKARENYQSLNA